MKSRAAWNPNQPGQLVGTLIVHRGVETWIRINDPSAGSPTETLLRLLLPLNDQV
jgi:hypothetical protein